MTYGYWISRARVHLGDAADELAGTGPVNAADVLAMTSTRAAVYRQLARHAGLLTPSTDPNAPWRGLVKADRLAAFRDRLRSAADDAPAPMPMPVAATSPAVRSLTAAADCLGVAGDILASHLEPAPRTPEGASIRAGGGVVSALADLARVAFDTIAVDLEAPGWLGRGDATVWPVGEPLAAAVARTTTGTMPHALAQVRAIAPAGRPLLQRLTTVPTVDRIDAPVHIAAAAAARLYAARTWLWRHPDRLNIAHVRLGTQLGLTATLRPATDFHAHPRARGMWRHAAAIASGIEGSPGTDEALAAARRLGDALTWTRAALERDELASVDAIATQLSSLAEILLAGTQRAVRRGDVFVPYTEPRAVRPDVVRITSGWRRAGPTDPDIVGLFQALSVLAHDQTPAKRSPAGRAFQQPPQAATATPHPPVPPTPAPAAAHRGRTR